MAKNVSDNNIIVTIKRHLDEPAMPYLADNKLDHAMYELKNAKQESLKIRNFLYLSLIINVGLLIYVCLY